MSILVVVSVIVLVVLAYMWSIRGRTTSTVEPFESQRPCSVYYLTDMNNQKGPCDAGYFEESVAVLRDQRDQLIAQNSSDPAVVQKIKDLTLALRTPRSGACKFTFDGWQETGSDPLKNGVDTNDIKSRNGLLQDGATANPKSNQWAFCYRPVNGFDQSQFQNSTAVTMYPNKVTGDTRYRMDFNYLDYENVKDAYCKTVPQGLPPNFPTENTPALIKLVYNGDTNNIRSVNLVVNNGLGELIVYEAARQFELEKTIYGKLFEVQLQNRDLVLVPKGTQLRLHKLYFNPCRGVNIKAIAPFYISFSTLVEEAIKTVDTVIMHGIDDNLVQYARSTSALDARINELTRQKYQLALDIETLDLKIKNTSKDLVFTQGILKRMFPISSAWESSQSWRPNANVDTHEGLNAFKNAVKKQAVANNSIREQIITQIGYGQSDWVRRTFHEYEGFIYLNAGKHRFKLNCDDAGEMLMASVPYRSGILESEMEPTKIVSTYYGMHGMDHQGRVTAEVVVAEGQQGYYKFMIHWFEWEGGDGYRVYHSINNSAFAVASATMFFTAKLNSTANDENLKQEKEREKGRVEVDIRNLVQIRTAIGSSTRVKAHQVVSAIAKLTLPRGLPIQNLSSDSAFYLWPGDLDIPVRPNAVPNTAPQYISENITDINSNMIEADPFVINLQKPPEYTVMMWLKIQSPNVNWRQIFFHGVGDDWANNKHDRTPGVWVYPANGWTADGKVRIHLRHVAKDCKGFDWRIHGGEKNCGLDMAWDQDTLPKYGEWFHFAATIQTLSQHNASEIKIYLNGKVYEQARMTDGNKFDWNTLYGKKLLIGTPQWKPLQSTGPMYIQKARWYSITKSATDIWNEYQTGYVNGGPTPYPAPIHVPFTLQSLFADLTVARTYQYKIGNAIHNVYVEPASAGNGNQPWLLILNYNRNAGDRKSPKIRRNEPHQFPQSLSQAPDAWGQVPKELLQLIPFASVRFLGTSGTNKIHFTTRHPDVIRYMKTGSGAFPISQANWFTHLSGHNARIPQYATNSYSNQGDMALHNAPFFISGKHHWDLGLDGKRWEVNDMTDNRNATMHSVWIGL